MTNINITNDNFYIDQHIPGYKQVSYFGQPLFIKEEHRFIFINSIGEIYSSKCQPQVAEKIKDWRITSDFHWSLGQYQSVYPTLVGYVNGRNQDIEIEDWQLSLCCL